MAKEKKQAKPKKGSKKDKKPEEKLANFSIGDKIKVYFKIKEGKRTREAFFEGQVIATKGSGNSQTFTVRRVGVDRVAIERIFPKNSPKITKIHLVEKAKKIRRAKLYYLRNQIGR